MTRMQQDRFAMLFVALFAAAGLVTAATGVYALLAYTVAQRRREIAVRMAIGASSSSVAWLIVMESLMLARGGLCRRRSRRGSRQSAGAIRPLRHRTSGSAHAGDDRGRSPHRGAGGELASGATCSENQSGVGDANLTPSCVG